MKHIKSLLIAYAIIFGITAVSLSYFGKWGEVAANPDSVLLPIFLLASLGRMLAAYALVVAFGLAIGITAGMYRKARIFMLPLLDILQSIPVLGYLPAFMLFFTDILPLGLGLEIASILLLFTGMAWAVTFNVISAVRAIPNDIREASNSFGMTGLRYVRHVILPAIMPSFVTGSVLAWGGGWYFLVAAEYLTFGVRHYNLPGIGYYLAKSVYELNNLGSAIFGLAVFVAMIYTINTVVWRPLISYCSKFKVQGKSSPLDIEYKQEKGSLVFKVADFIAQKRYLADELVFSNIDKLNRFVKKSFSLRIKYIPRKRHKTVMPWWKHLSLYSVLFGAVMAALAVFIAASLQKPLSDLSMAAASHPETYNLPGFLALSLIRILAAYLIALAWTLCAAILLVRHKRLYQLFFPIFDIGQSTPALALFPFIVIFVINFIGGGRLGVEAASVLLLLTGTQWYLLFNLIAAIKSIPGEINEASQAFGIKGITYYTTVLLPGILPGLINGSVQAWGGAWNSLIVSEYISFGGKTLMVDGLGSYLTKATIWGEPTLVALAVAIMALSVIAINMLVWRRLFNYVERFRFESG
ncbi:ABC transporter permease subunit [Candidatus Parvarchaeota archaeon]|nr:ABC transporter permease subunit [Candidatus Parvarchaeota archaeon]